MESVNFFHLKQRSPTSCILWRHHNRDAIKMQTSQIRIRFAQIAPSPRDGWIERRRRSGSRLSSPAPCSTMHCSRPASSLQLLLPILDEVVHVRRRRRWLQWNPREGRLHISRSFRNKAEIMFRVRLIAASSGILIDLNTLMNSDFLTWYWWGYSK